VGKLDPVYARLPVPAQNAAVTAYGGYWYWMRFGGKYKRHLEGYLARDRWDHERWEAHTRSALKRVLDVAMRVPYYRETWTSLQIRAAKAGSLEELPLLGKEPVRESPKQFTDDGRGLRRPLVFHTSGSTGTPIRSMWTADELRSSLAVREARSARWAGTSFKVPRATFSGRIVEPDPNSEGPYYRYNRVERQVYLSAFHLGPATAGRYVKALWDREVEWLTGYAMSFYLLARHILEQRLDVPPLRAVVTTSEKVNLEMRRTMESAYRCPVYEEYSTVENVLFASECEERRLHVSPDIGFVEILDEDGLRVPPGVDGEVVATTLMRTYQPMIRFRLGDVARWSGNECPCGRSMPVLDEVVGRVEDVVVAPDGREMVRFHGIFIDLPHVREGQIVQEALDRILVKVVPTPDFDESDEQQIITRVTQRLGAQVAVRVGAVESIPRMKSGKYKAVVSRMARPQERDHA
jgi:phenylacetate-CoA ligase